MDAIVQRASVEADNAHALQLIVNVTLMSVGIAGSGKHFVLVCHSLLAVTQHHIVNAFERLHGN